jgi:1-aminocyclopropane-1-carboxylate deaminase/D-cysteine desulfhydrase-like pyridoxal-dependent ACC family enzyme
MTDYLANEFPTLAKHLPKASLASLPTPVTQASLITATGLQSLLIKCDDRTGCLYGGNKVRKLEYILSRARAKGAQRVATFGTVASNHALATAV